MQVAEHSKIDSGLPGVRVTSEPTGEQQQPLRNAYRLGESLAEVSEGIENPRVWTANNVEHRPVYEITDRNWILREALRHKDEE